MLWGLCAFLTVSKLSETLGRRLRKRQVGNYFIKNMFESDADKDDMKTVQLFFT